MTIGSKPGAIARRFAGVLLAAFLLAGSAGGALAGQPWYVAPGGNDLNPGTGALPFATIQRAIAEAQSGDEVLVGDGVYRGEGNRAIDFLGKAIIVRSQSGVRANCTIRADSSYGFVFRSGETNTSLIMSLTIAGAAAGVNVQGAYPRIVDCVLDSCVTGIDVRYYGSRVAVEDCLIRRGTTGLLLRDDATGGSVSSTSICEHSGNGVQTQGEWTIPAFDGLVLKDCRIYGNQGAGVGHWAAFGGVQAIDCEVFDNGDWGLRSSATGDRGLAVQGGAVHGNGAGGIDTRGSAYDGVAACEVYGNAGPGILTAWDAVQRITDCNVHDNAGHGIGIGNGPASAAKAWQSIIVSGCTIYGNDGCGIDVVASVLHHENLVTGCIIRDNQGPGIRFTAPPTPRSQARFAIEKSTIIGNGDGIQVDSTLPISVDHALIAYNFGAAVDCLVDPTLTLSCSDLYGNAGGDWVGAIADQLGSSGNLEADPLLCDLPGGDYALLEISPCAGTGPAGCGVIGALGVGCYAAPRITTLADVPEDQGGLLRLAWQASHFDRPGVVGPVTGYGVYRRQGGTTGGDEDRPDGRTPALAGAKRLGWDWLATVPSRGDEGYQFLAPTLCDLPAAGGDSAGCRSVFMVAALTGDPFVHYDSAPDSGCSRDNLAPAAPTGLHLESDRRLAWLGGAEADFAHFTVYGSATGRLDGGATCLGCPTVTGLDVRAAPFRHFLVTATDVHGNEGEAAALDASTGVDGSPAATLRLYPCQPNPFNPSTTLRFDLPGAGPVRVTVYDLAGRRVRTVIDDSLAGGSHAVVWDGRDAAGRSAGAGTYLARLEFAGGARTVRMGLAK